MKVKWFLVVICLNFLLTLISGRKISLASYAINAIIEEHFTSLQASHPGYVDIVYFGQRNDQFEALLRLKSATTVTSIYNYEKGQTEDDFYQLRESSVVFFESVELFKKCASMVKWEFNREKRYQHLAYAPGLQLDDLYESNLNGFSVDHVSFLVDESETSISLVTDYMFTQGGCRSSFFEPINSFELSTLKWEHSIFYPKKYQNFHGCELTIKKDYNNILELMLFIFEDLFNAKLIACESDMENCDLTSIEYPFVGESSNLLSNPHQDEIVTYIIAPGEPYTDLERMFMMFDTKLWMAIGTTLVIGLLTTVILDFVSDEVRNFVIGRDVQSPIMNFFSIFLIGGQPRTPGRNFARFIFILFVVWSLIIRTCHQSMLFQLMQSDLRRPTIRTIDEVFESNLTLFDFGDSIYFDTDFWDRMNKTQTKYLEIFFGNSTNLLTFFYL